MNQNYAGFGVRFVAWFIDAVIVSLGNTAIVYMGEALLGDTGAAIGNLAGLVIPFVYYVWYQAKEGQTVGKKVMKIKVVTYDGKSPTMFTFFLRDIIGKLISGIVLGFGYLMILWDPRKQGLHDKIANTLVVRVGDVTKQGAVQDSTQQQTPSPVQNPQAQV